MKRDDSGAVRARALAVADRRALAAVDWSLLVGVSIGGAGAFVGSLASLIAIRHFVSARKIYPALRVEGAPSVAAFLGKLALLNFAFLAVLVLVCLASG